MRRPVPEQLGWLMVALLGACAGEQRAQRAEAPPARSARAECTADAACPERALCVSQRCVEIGPFTAPCFGLSVPFEPGASELGPRARPAIERLARCLRAEQQPVVLLRDRIVPRGRPSIPSQEVGDARATAASAELARLGATEEQRRRVAYTTGYQPACPRERDGCAARRIDWSRESLEATRKAPPSL